MVNTNDSPSSQEAVWGHAKCFGQSGCSAFWRTLAALLSSQVCDLMLQWCTCQRLWPPMLQLRPKVPFQMQGMMARATLTGKLRHTPSSRSGESWRMLN